MTSALMVKLETIMASVLSFLAKLVPSVSMVRELAFPSAPKAKRATLRASALLKLKVLST